MKPMETLQDLIEEAKTRTICWAICIFAISYFLSHTSKSMWVNIPISAMILVAFRYLSYEVELRWKLRPAPRPTYLLHLEKKQLSLDDPRLSTMVSSSRWKRKIDSPPVEAAIEGFISKILHDFVIDLWYSSITPDKEAPELIRSLILDVLGEISGRVRGINLVDLLTRNLVDLIGNQLDLYRKNQSEIGVEVMGTLSFEERDERLKHHLIASKELHPALFSSESEQKVLQHIIGGVLALVLKPRDAQCPLVRCISRELLTCLVMQPVMNFASPWYINELIEYMFLNKGVEVDADKSINSTNLSHGHNNADSNIQNDHVEHQTSTSNINQLALVKSGNEKSVDDPEHDHKKKIQKDYVPKQAEWAMVLDAATKRRSEVLAPENLENMWTKGRNYQKKTAKFMKAGGLSSSVNSMPSSGNNVVHTGNTGKELVTDMSETIKGIDEKYMVHLMQGSGNNEQKSSLDMVKRHNKEMPRHGEQGEDNARTTSRNVKVQIKRSSSTSDLNTAFMKRSDTSNLREDYDPNHTRSEKGQTSELVLHSEETLHAQKIKCRVIGAYFEKIGSKSFAVYSIAVTDVVNTTWFVKRRYRNFERLHRNLKDIPNYSLHLPPKRFLSSSIDDYFVHQRCILLDKYLQELLSIANIAEQHEVWDFLSESSKNYSFGKSTSVMQTLAVNVDDAMDDIVRQFKGVSDGLRRKVVGPSTSNTSTSPVVEKRLAISWNEELHKQISGSHEMESSHSLSDEEIHDDDSSPAINSGWHSDNELNSKSFPPRILNHNEKTLSLESQRSTHSERNARMDLDASKSSVITDFQDPVGMPPEWTPPNVSVPLLNLVDKVFQLNRRGWLRRQVYWLSKQVLQLMMEDAIDDWILRQIHLLRKDDVIAQGILWIQDVLWPNGKFFKELESSQRKKDDVPSQRPSQNTSRVNGDNAHGASSFEQQLEAARRASDVKKMILGGAPTALVSLIGPSQYKRSAKDIYYFLQSTICIKQLAYSMLELMLVTIFPELRDLMIDIHEKACYQAL